MSESHHHFPAVPLCFYLYELEGVTGKWAGVHKCVCVFGFPPFYLLIFLCCLATILVDHILHFSIHVALHELCDVYSDVAVNNFWCLFAYLCVFDRWWWWYRCAGGDNVCCTSPPNSRVRKPCLWSRDSPTVPTASHLTLLYSISPLRLEGLLDV